MRKFILKTDPRVEQVFANYPNTVRDKMQFLRKLVIETAEETEGIQTLEETLKWGAEFCNQERQHLANGLEGKSTEPVCDVFSVYESLS
jgi:hypothetical protein